MPHLRRDTIKRRGFFQFNIIGCQIVNIKAARAQNALYETHLAGFGRREFGLCAHTAAILYWREPDDEEIG